MEEPHVYNVVEVVLAAREGGRRQTKWPATHAKFLPGGYLENLPREITSLQTKRRKVTRACSSCHGAVALHESLYLTVQPSESLIACRPHPLTTLIIRLYTT